MSLSLSLNVWKQYRTIDIPSFRQLVATRTAHYGQIPKPMLTYVKLRDSFGLNTNHFQLKLLQNRIPLKISYFTPGTRKFGVLE